MVKMFDKTFTAKQQRQDQNLQAIQDMESVALQRLLPMTEQKDTKVSQRERVKAKRLRETYLDQDFNKNKGPDIFLFITLKPLYYLNVEKVQHVYLPKPQIRERLSNVEIKERLQQLVREVQEEIGLSYKFRNIFKRDGSKVWDLYDMYTGDNLFFISSKDTFIGLDAASEKYPGGMKKLLTAVISQSNPRWPSLKNHWSITYPSTLALHPI